MGCDKCCGHHSKNAGRGPTFLHLPVSSTLQQLQTLDERRTVSIQGYMKKAAEIHRQVLPIVGKCLDGIVVAADSIDAKKVGPSLSLRRAIWG